MEENKNEESFRGNRSSFREVSIKYMAGTIDREDLTRFRRLLFRVTRGKKCSK
jgi:hypothetical protein